ncbi:acyl--CoA ligase [Pseudomonas fluorescens]|uniref:class I adenylate-forming enzyme family protein n=1 Tax=Pseudomonas TaxID=286 RepID=UPI000812257A|nr:MULTISPECIES: class I adenylate-forming enzyme family protein [Pseudomonas]MBD8099210.1 acyl--CoA ligase [Pseudomonas fluorescens]MBD8774129.1 acyl--CoA ligase [Pseudomonas fluorescens]MBD8780841.1 acyl--CoA ligase [Pseudomonas fluorescens]MBD8796718.1 acyl--CoA ligase [Pseudomonas fluorescens]CRM79607.1 Linear gramicidin synthase subunit A [Pseudomonas sp. 37 R 15]
MTIETDRFCLSALLDTAVALAGDQPFIASGSATLTYREFNSAVLACTHRLSALGVRRGERVLIVNSAVMQTAILAFACARLQCVFVIVDPGARSATMNYIVEDCSPALVIGSAVADPHYREVNVQPWGEKAWRDTRCTSSCAQDDAVCILYTSGSTGRPKGVVINNGGLQFVLAAIQHRLGYREHDVVACYLPLSFDYGLYQLFLACQVRASVVLRSPAPTSALLVSAIKQDRITVLPLVPSLWEAMVYQLKRRAHACDGLALRIITSTGQALHTQLIDGMRTLLPHVELFPMYGLTECKRVSILLPEEYPSKKGSVGRPLAGTCVRVCDEQGVTLMPGEIGELVVTGDHVADYWAGAEVINDEVFRSVDGQRRLHTGDYGYMDTDGFIFLVGRRDMLIKRRAHRISLSEIESCLYDCPFITAAAVTWDADSDRLTAFVVVSPSTNKHAEHIHDYLADVLEPYKLPDHYLLLESFPLTANGKVNRAALNPLWLKQTP